MDDKVYAPYYDDLYDSGIIGDTLYESKEEAQEALDEYLQNFDHYFRKHYKVWTFNLKRKISADNN